MGTSVIVGMAVATVASAVTQGILQSTGKQTEAGYVDLATKSGMAVTALTIFAKFVKTLSGL
jgi:hypothetical protein